MAIQTVGYTISWFYVNIYRKTMKCHKWRFLDNIQIPLRDSRCARFVKQMCKEVKTRTLDEDVPTHA